MKVRFIAFSIGFMAAFAIVNAQDLVAYWDFDEAPGGVIADQSGNGYDARIEGGPGELVEGVKNKALRIAGEGLSRGANGEYILLPEIPLENFAEYTINIWVKEISFSYSHGEAYIWFGVDYGYNRIGIHRAPFGANIASGEHLFFSAGPLENDIAVPFDLEWRDKFMMYTLTFSDDTISAYMNGELLKKQVIEEPVLPVDTKYAGLGTHWWSQYHYQTTRFTGAFDEIKIYKQKLEAEDIQNTYEEYTHSIGIKPIPAVKRAAQSSLPGSRGIYSINGKKLSDNAHTIGAAIVIENGQPIFWGKPGRCNGSVIR